VARAMLNTAILFLNAFILLYMDLLGSIIGKANAKQAKSSINNIIKGYYKIFTTLKTFF